MDPFGDDTHVEDHVLQEMSEFAPPADTSGDFYEVEPTEAPTKGADDANDLQTGERYQHMNFALEQPVEMHEGFQMAPSAEIPLVEEDNELTKFMHEYEKQIAVKAQEQEKVAVECKAKAEEGMAQFLAERQRVKESKMQSNRVFEQAATEKMVADLQNENPWERVVTLVDLETSRKKKLEALHNEKDSDKQVPKPVAVPAKKTPEDEEDVSRMRQLFVQLKATPLEQTRAGAVAAK